MKLLTIFNTCGIKRDNTREYINNISNLYNQQLYDGNENHIVLSSCLNSELCRDTIKQVFKDKISYSFIDEKISVNLTFNKTVKECVKHFGEFDAYHYVDSGVDFGKQSLNILNQACNFMKSGPYGIVSLQADTDTGFEHLFEGEKHSTGKYFNPGRVVFAKKDKIIPVGKAVNMHSIIFSNKLFQTFDNRIMPDVFAAYCTDSVPGFLAASVNTKWAIMKDVMIFHKHGMDGGTSFLPHKEHWSPKHGNTWNNLLCDRDALDFINNEEALSAGLGYEECNEIMMHRPEAYDEEGYAKYPEKLQEQIMKWFFLTKEEVNYDNISCDFTPSTKLPLR